MGWLSGILAVVCLVVGLFHLARLAVRRQDVASELAHAVMGLGMAAMFSPLGNPVPAPVWTVLFALLGLWFAGAVLYSRTFGGAATHHVIGSGAMLFMLAAGHAAPAADPAAHAGHAAHGGGTAETLGMASAVALVLAGYFAWHALRCSEAFRQAEPAAPGPSVVSVRAPARPLHDQQLAAVAHVVMAVAMAVMLFGMV
jgi:hypothetical protein